MDNLPQPGNPLPDFCLFQQHMIGITEQIMRLQNLPASNNALNYNAVLAAIRDLNTQMDERFAQVAAQFAHVNGNLAQVNDNLAQVNQRIDVVNDDITSIREEIDELREMADRMGETVDRL